MRPRYEGLCPLGDGYHWTDGDTHWHLTEAEHREFSIAAIWQRYGALLAARGWRT